MNTFTDIRNVAVNVTDQDAAVRSYTDALGFATHVDGDTPAGRWIIMAHDAIWRAGSVRQRPSRAARQS